MVDQLQVAIAFLLYMFVFGWIGWRRGMNRELIVLITSVITLIIVRLQGDILIRIADLGWQLFNMILSGGLSDSGTTDTPTTSSTAWTASPAPMTSTASMASTASTTPLITTCSDTVTTCNAPGYLFLFWVSVVIFAYIIGTVYVKKSPSNGWAILIGIANGFVYASVVLPRLFALINPGAVDLGEPIILDSLRDIIRAAWSSISGVISGLWASVGSLQPYLLLLFLIFLVVGAASTLRKA